MACSCADRASLTYVAFVLHIRFFVRSFAPTAALTKEDARREDLQAEVWASTLPRAAGLQPTGWFSVGSPKLRLQGVR
eukprot:3559368-Prymnesium_polylepis.1